MVSRATASRSTFAVVLVSPASIQRLVVTSVSHATRPSGSCDRMRSSTASETLSQSLSGWPSVTDSEVKSCVPLRCKSNLRSGSRRNLPVARAGGWSLDSRGLEAPGPVPIPIPHSFGRRKPLSMFGESWRPRGPTARCRTSAGQRRRSAAERGTLPPARPPRSPACDSGDRSPQAGTCFVPPRSAGPVSRTPAGRHVR